MVAKFAGKRYKLASADNFETYLKHIGVSEDNIKLYLSVTPSLDIQIQGDTYIINTYSQLGNRNVTFKVGEEFMQKLLDGREVKTVFTIEGDKIVETHKEQALESVVTREFSDSEVKIVMRAGDVVATRIYKAE